MLYLIGLGLSEGDISLKAAEAMKKCDALYCELYTSYWEGNLDKLSKTIGKKIAVLEREKVESDFLVNEVKKKAVALLVPGDPLSATTHMQLVMDAKENGIETEIIHAASIYTAVAESGLQLYKFGRSTTLAMPEKNFFPESPYDIIADNLKLGFHTLVLLDIPMTAKKGIEVLLELEKKKKKGMLKKDSRIIACCKLGGNERVIKYGTADALLKDSNLDTTPAVLLVPGKLHFKEEEALSLWKS